MEWNYHLPLLQSVSNENGKFLVQSYLTLVVFSCFLCKQIMVMNKIYFFPEHSFENHAISSFLCYSCKLIAITMKPIFSHKFNKLMII